ncbi:MAG: RlmE family RNA methyltransferase [Candidatus Lokiarchaeota archaeon]|nr:RlmE family RNA methyltransferase [Candidatus Lokiarchaeota archaeon]
MSKRWLAEHRSDEYHNKSKEDGFRARSAYKLLHINEKFHIFKNVRNVLDLGASPGSWLQVTLSQLKEKRTKILGVDQKKIREIEGVKQLKMDVYSDQLEDEIKTYFPKGIDLLLSDLAPNTSGNKTYDAARSVDLVNRAFEIAEKFLQPGGNLVAKLFHCPEIKELKRKFEQTFQKVQFHKPKASRQHSREIFIIALGYKNKKNNK